MEDINAEHESKFRPNWLKVDIPNMSLSGWYAWGRDPGIYMENSGWIRSTIQMINQIRIMDHLSNISSIAWIKYAIADSSIMECWREMSASILFPLSWWIQGSHRWGVSGAAWKGSWVGWYNHQGETQKDSWYIIQLWGIKISSGMIVLVKFGVNISGREWTLLPHTSYVMVWFRFYLHIILLGV